MECNGKHTPHQNIDEASTDSIASPSPSGTSATTTAVAADHYHTLRNELTYQAPQMEAHLNVSLSPPSSTASATKTRRVSSPPSRRSPRNKTRSAKARAFVETSIASDSSSSSRSRSVTKSSSEKLQPILGKPSKSKKNLTATQIATRAARLSQLQADSAIIKGTIEPQSVRCIGCRQRVKLDQRYEYGLGSWFRHRVRCRGLGKLGLNDVLLSGDGESKGKGGETANSVSPSVEEDEDMVDVDVCDGSEASSSKERSPDPLMTSDQYQQHLWLTKAKFRFDPLPVLELASEYTDTGRCPKLPDDWARDIESTKCSIPTKW